MNPPTWREAKQLLEATKKAANGVKADIIVAPPSIFLRELRASYKGRQLSFAVQNVHTEKMGPHTGEISAQQAADSGASYAIVGHSERRTAGETNDDTRRKMMMVVAAGMVPILCVGELTRTQNADHLRFIKEQLQAGLADVSAAKLSKVLIAYEPLWAVGGSEAIEPRQMHEMAIFIRKTLVESHGEMAHKVRILYGGSIDAGNAAGMLEGGDVVGLLVGRASVDAMQFSSLLRAIQQA